MHTIGIDFGTTKTLVSRIKSRTGEAETVRLGQGTDHIPTSVFIKDNGDMLFGDEADDRLTEADGVYLRGFKMSLGNSTPVYAQMNDEGELIQYMAAELVTRYLSYIRTRVQETVFSGEPITRAIITRPVDFSPARCEELRQAAIAAGFTEVELTTEPEAAGLAFCRLNDAQAFRHSALIVDWGGGTLDFALVTREEKHIITHPNLTAGDITMGGERFDHLLWSYAENQLRKHAIFNVNPVAMLPIVRKNKERLSASDTATLRLSHEHGTCPPIELTQQLFNRLINDSVERAADKIMQLLERIPEADKPEMLLLVGGSCRIPYIKRKLEEVCKLPAVSWHLSREAVSLGAALWDSTAIPVPLVTPITLATTEAPDEPMALTPEPPTSSARKRTFGKVMTLGALLATATSAPFIYTHFSEEAEQSEDEAAQHIAAAEAKAKAAEEARLKAEAKTKAEEVARLKAEAEAKSKAEEVARLKAAEEAKAKAEQEARQKALAQAKQETEKITVAHSELDSVLASLDKSICTSDDLKSIESKINDIKTIRDEVKMSIVDIGKKASSNPELTELNNLIASLDSKLGKADERLNKQKQQLAAKAEAEAKAKAKEEARKKALAQAKQETEKITVAHSELDLVLASLAKSIYSTDDLKTIEAKINEIKTIRDEVKMSIADIVKKAPNAPEHTELNNLLASMSSKLDKADEMLNKQKQQLTAKEQQFRNIPKSKYDSKLLIAAKNNDVILLKLLLDAGADKDKADKYGLTPLHYAARSGYSECVKLLIKAGANVNYAPGREKVTPLHSALRDNQIECVKLLLAAGADKNKADLYGNTPLHWAGGHEECMNLLLEAGADMNKSNIDGNTPLFECAYEDISEGLTILLEAGANMDKPNNYGCTPLHGAASRGFSKCIKLLIKKGAKVNKRNNKGETPLDIAKSGNYTECIRLLEAAGAK